MRYILRSSSGASPTLIQTIRSPAGRLASASIVRPETWGKTPAGIGQLRKSVLEGAAQIGAADIDGEDAVVERQFGENIARSQRRARRVDPSRAAAAPPRLH